MSEELPSEYDAIVLGTGIAESILAASLTRIGHKVLHLDRNDYYGGDWATFNWNGTYEWIENEKKEELFDSEKFNDVTKLLEEGETSIGFLLKSSTVTNLVVNRYISDKAPDDVQKTNVCESNSQKEETDKSSQSPEGDSDSKEPEQKATSDESISNKNKEGESGENKAEDTKPEGAGESSHAADNKSNEKKWTFDELQKKWRLFNVDLTPKLLFSRGSMVELLISSDVAKYCEFKSVTRILTLINDKLEKVPCSRSDVFSSKQVSMIEKRMLMKLLTFCMNYENQPEEYAGFEDGLFKDFLKSKKLTKNVQHYVQNSIAMATDKTSTLEGLKSTQKFLQSLGRYGNTAFLWPMYGVGELPQCYCRMCAVFEGIYCLRRTAAHLILDSDKKCKGIIDTEGKRLSCKWLISEASYIPEIKSNGKPKRYISRAILVTDRSVLGADQENITLLSIPPKNDSDHAITLYEASYAARVCPQDLYMIHLTCQSSGTAQEDFKEVIENMFCYYNEQGQQDETTDEKPKILWSLFFNMLDTATVTPDPSLPDNVHILSGPDGNLDFDRSIAEARALFEKLCPGEEFLPKAPNPEDIIYDDGNQSGPKESGFETKEDGASSNQPEKGDNCDDTTQREGGGSKKDGVCSSLDEKDKDCDQSSLKEGGSENKEDIPSEKPEEKCEESNLKSEDNETKH